MIFNLNDSAVAEGTILVFGIRYPSSNSGGTYTYAGMKAGGRWYFTGKGRTPQDAGWGAVKRWLASDGRQVAWVKVATSLEMLWERDAVARANHPSRTGSPAASMASMVAEQNGDDPYDMVGPYGEDLG